MKMFCLAVSLFVYACAAPPAQRVVRDVPDTQLAAVPAGAVFADGNGSTQMDAIRDAQAALIRRIAHDTQTAFEWPDLLNVLETRTDGQGTWVARVELQHGLAKAHCERERRQVEVLLAEVQPALDAALRSRDPGILLRRDTAPDALLARWRAANALGALLGLAASEAPAVLVRTAPQAQQARARTVISLTVSGQGSEYFRRVAKAQMIRLLVAQGCVVGTPRAGDVAVQGRVKIAVREHFEEGMDWRYLGLALTMGPRSAPFFVFDGMPEFAHGGGRGAQAAEDATERNLIKALDARARSAFETLVCGDS